MFVMPASVRRPRRARLDGSRRRGVTSVRFAAHAPARRAHPACEEPTTVWSTIENKVRNGQRLTTDEGVYLLSTAPLLELGALAQEVRARKTDPAIVTYVIDTNPNYTNICTVDCHFCAF